MPAVQLLLVMLGIGRDHGDVDRMPALARGSGPPMFRGTTRPSPDFGCRGASLCPVLRPK